MIEQIDQLIIGDKASYDDFMASLSKRTIKQPKKKVIKETVPFSNITYDFSAINGEIYWEERELEYVFEIMADDPEELEELKRKFSSWLINIQEAEICDPFIPDYHFIGTYEDMSYADEEDVEKTTATVIFKAYPYMIANIPKVYESIVPGTSEIELSILNESSHQMTPTISSDIAITLIIDSTTFEISEGTITDEMVKLPQGLSTIILKNVTETPATVTISLYEEVV